MVITSRQNNIFKEALSLSRKKERKKSGLFIAEGLRFIKEIDGSVKHYIVAESFAKEHDLNEYQKNADIYIFDDSLFNAICDTDTPQGIAALCYIKNYNIDELLFGSFYVVAENIQDPGNIGTIIRTAYSFGADAVVLTEGCADLYNSKTLRSTMGAVFHIPVIQYITMEDTLNKLKSKNIKLYAAHLKGNISPEFADFKSPSAFLIGNEANGLTEYASSQADALLKIPMNKKAESLNASVAAAIFMYELVRQRNIL